MGCALAALWAAPASAENSLQLFTPGTIEVSGDFRLVAIDGEQSWVNGGFGKLRSGSDGNLKLQAQLGNASFVWKPQLAYSIGAVIVGSVQGGQRTEAGLSQAYLTYVRCAAAAASLSPPVPA